MTSSADKYIPKYPPRSIPPDTLAQPGEPSNFAEAQLTAKLKKTVPEILREGAATYEERNKLYGDNYKKIGEIMHVLFPRGILITSPEDHNRFGCWYMAFNKLVRYSMQMETGGHLDSARDAMVYSAMLEELTK